MILVAIAKNDSSAEVATFAHNEYAKVNGLLPVKVEYTHREDGSPYLAGSALYVSVSHSGEYVVAAVSDGKVGIDIQELRAVDFKSISARFNLETDDIRAFYRAFSTAEAYAKATGTPLPTALKKTAHGTPNAVTYEFIEGYILALCSDGKDTPLFCFKFR